MHKKTNEQFLSELYKTNANIEPLELYAGAKEKIKVKCNICEHEWYATPNDILNGRGCAKCSGVYKMTHDEYEKELLSVNPNISLIGKYLGKNKRIETRCNICGRIWFPFAGNLLRGYGCKKCKSQNKKVSKQILTCTRTKPVRKKGHSGNTDSKNKTNTKSHETFVNEINSLGKTVELITEYKNQKTKVFVRCKICGDERWVLPAVLLRVGGSGCPKCSVKNAGLKLRKSHEEFVAEVGKINPHIEIVSRYTKQDEAISVCCQICGHIHSITASKLLTRIYNCPICSDNITFPNKFMHSILMENNIEFESEKVFSWSNNKRYDFYIPSMSTIIEMNGEQHYRERNPKSSWGVSLEEIQKKR